MTYSRAMRENPLAHHFKTLAYNSAWSNHRLLAACARLTKAEFTAPRVSFFPSLAATLNHNLTVDWYYVDALEHSLAGRPPNPEARRFFDVEVPHPVCAELIFAQRAVDRRLIEACASLTDPRLDTPIAILRKTGVEHERADRLLSHVFQHQIHHRGQAHAMLAGTHVPPPQLDEFFCENEAHLRAPEFAELGFTEEHIWGGG